MTALEEIKKALEGVTVQEWTFDGPANSIIIWCGEDTRVCFMTSDGPAKEHAKFITACNPASISELLSTLESLQRENEALKEENGSLLDENSDLRNEPWPEWAKAVLKVVRSHTGYDGYDDATEGVDMPLELEEHLSELQSVNDRLQFRAEAAEAEVARLQAEIDRTERNRDMWKGQVDRQAAQLEDFRSETKRLQVGVYVETLPAVHLISVFADDMNERNWDDKRAYIKQQADRIRTALASTGGEHHGN